MAKKYISPTFGDVDPISQGSVDWDSARSMKDDISTSFVYGDDSYEEEYVVPDVVEELVSADSGSEEAGE